MKAELRLNPHQVLRSDVVEVWYGGEMIATIYGWDGPGIRVITKHQLQAQRLSDPPLCEVVVQVHR